MNYFKNCNTLDEAKKLYWDLAKQLHPDKGGDEEAFKVLGNEFEAFKPNKQKYSTECDDWSSAEYAEIVEALLKISDIEVEICGSWIWLSGETKSHKDEIKAIDTGDSYKRGWHSKKSMWYFSPKSYRKFSKKESSMDEIRGMYGSDKIKSNGKVGLQS